MDIVGFVPADSGVMLCANCAADDIASEDAERGSVVWDTSETDTPSHCDECGALIAETLTDDGERYVCDALAEYISAAVFTRADGRAKHGGMASVLDAWREEYGDTLADGSRIVALYDKLRSRQRERLSVLLVSYHRGYGRADGTDADGAYWTETDAREDGDADECAECGAAVYGGWLCMDGGDVVCSAHVLTPDGARGIAADWHDGQSSALYALASSGAALADVKWRVERELTALDVPSSIREERIERSTDNPSWRPHAYRVPRMPLEERSRERNRLRALAAWIDGVRSRGYADAALAIRDIVRDADKLTYSRGIGSGAVHTLTADAKLERIADALRECGLSV